MCNSFFSHLQFFPHLWLIWKSSTVCRHSKTRTLSLFSVSLLLFPEIETKLPFSATVSSVDFGMKYRYYITHVHSTCAPLTPQEEPISQSPDFSVTASYSRVWSAVHLWSKSLRLFPATSPMKSLHEGNGHMNSSREAFWWTSRRDLSQKFKLVWTRGTSGRDQSWSLRRNFEAKWPVHTMGLVPATCWRD